MRGKIAKKLRQVARREERALMAKHVTVERRWYARRWVFTLFAWPITNLIVVPLNWLGWHSLGVRWVEWCKQLHVNGNRLVLRRKA